MKERPILFQRGDGSQCSTAARAMELQLHLVDLFGGSAESKVKAFLDCVCEDLPYHLFPIYINVNWAFIGFRVIASGYLNFVSFVLVDLGISSAGLSLDPGHDDFLFLGERS